MKTSSLHFLWCVFFSVANMALAVLPPADPPLPGYDRRAGTASGLGVVSPAQQLAVERLRLRQPQIQVEFDPITSGPKSITARGAFLSGSQGLGGAIPAEAASKFAVGDPHRATKAFLQEYRDLFGYGPEVLAGARVKQQFVTPHNGLRTVVWQQEVDGVPVFEAVLISHTSRRGELVNLSSRMLPGATTALKRTGQSRADVGVSLKVSARQALAIAAGQIGEQLSEAQIEVESVSNAGPLAPDPEKRQKFKAPVLKGEAEAKVVWLPMNEKQLCLCWDVILTGRKRGEMFRVLVDVRTGEPLLRRCLTEYISDATYDVFTSDSPSPFSPGFSMPASDQPPLVSRSLLTISALDTNASPNGWIDDGVNETLGNNVDAHTDLNGDDQPDLPRPHGSPFRVFDFPLDLANDPSTYRDAAVVQLFYWCNWMHDQLYGLGFTEAAGNFQSDNFGRGGLGGDAVQADAQDGSGVNNSNFSTPPDGSPGRMQMYIFTGPSPARDGDLDAEVILHEYTHGLSNRRVGGGIGISSLQPMGMGEGWSDFYALSLLSQPGDDVNGVYAMAAYVAYQLGGLTQNYYFGIRRYPYCTDLGKNPLTFKDIDPSQASSHFGIPRNPVIGTYANEVHNMGEVWCVTLWEARANLIDKYGWTAGNRLMLQLVTDGMALSPPNPSYLQARDAILQADLVDSGGVNQLELWQAFAKRGMGSYATCPDSSTTAGLQESFELPDDLQVKLISGGTFSFQSGRVQIPSCGNCLLGNTGSNILAWTATSMEPWVSVDPASGSIIPGTSIAVSICLNAAANMLPSGNYSATVVFSNTASGAIRSRSLALELTPTQAPFFSLDTDPGWPREGEWEFGLPAGLGGTEDGYPDPTTAASGTNVFGVNLNGDYSLEIGGPYFLTAGPFNFSGYTGMSLHFLRWLNSDFQPYVYDTIEVSPDGTNWNPVWDNGTSAIADDAWTPETYDISAWADNQTNVFVRWGYRVASLAFAYSGWNIDDIGFLGNPARQLTVGVPSVANVGTGILTGTVWASPAPTNDLTVSLASSDAAAIAVPVSVTIPAGQSTAVFNLTVASQLDGRAMETVMIGAVAPNYVAGSTNIQVLDDAGMTLQLSLPGTAIESQGTLEGEVYIRDVQTNTLLVQLSSSDTTVLRVPDSIFIPVGQTTAVFAATVVYDNMINGPQFAMVSAHAPGWLDATGSVVIGLPAVVVMQPTNLAAAVGGVAAMGIVAEGTAPLSYQWSVGGTNLVDATNSVLVITNVQLSDAGSYAVEVSNAFGSEQSSNAVLSVGLAPAIVVQPMDQTVRLGGAAAFEVVAEGTAPLTYQWSLGGASLTDATNSALVLTNVQSSDGGSYAVVVSNAFGVTSSTNAALTIELPAVIVMQPTNLAVAVGGLAAIGIVADGTAPLSYQWSLGGTNLLDGTNSVLVITNVQLSDAGSYAVEVSNAFGSEQSSNAVLSVGLAPAIVVQPMDQTVRLGGTAAFEVMAEGTAPLAYQWSLGGASLVDATNSVLAITNVQLSDGGSCAVRVSNAFGIVRSTNVALTIELPAVIVMQPTNLAVAVGAVAAMGIVAEGTAPLSYQWNVGGTNLVDATNSVLVITNVQLSDAGSYAVEVSNAFGSDQSSNAVLSVGLAPAIVLQPLDQTVRLGGSATFEVVAEGTAPLAYQWSLGGMSLADATNSVLVLTNVQWSDGGSYALVVSNAFGMASSTNAVLTIGLPAVIVQQPTNLAVAVDGAAVMGIVANGTAPLGYQWSLGGTNLVDATNSVLVITNVQLSDAGSYAVEVSNAFGSEQSSNAVLSVGFAPAIVAQPTDQTVWLGGSVVWAVVAEGTAPLAYQWSLGGASLADATNSALVLTNVQPRDGGSYAVVVSNAFGMASSINAVLTIGLPAMIVQQPTNLAVAVGGVAVMGIVADGTAPLAYQWSLGGTNLVDATNSVLVITNVQLSDAGSYAVEVSNAFGSDQSSNATLLVYVIDHFAWDAIPSPVLVNVPFAVRIQALDASNDLVTNFTGRVVLKSTAGVSVNPSNSGDFVQGQWTGSVTISQAASGAVLTATDDSDHSGYANPIDVVSVPSLSIELAGNSVLISWPADVPAFVLESSSDYSSWAQLSIPVGLSANNYVVRLRTSGARAYYRLRFVAPPSAP